MSAHSFFCEVLLHRELARKFQCSSMIFVFLIISLSVRTSVCTSIRPHPSKKKIPLLNGFLLVLVLLSALVERFGVSHMRDFFSVVVIVVLIINILFFLTLTTVSLYSSSSCPVVNSVGGADMEFGIYFTWTHVWGKYFTPKYSMKYKYFYQ